MRARYFGFNGVNAADAIGEVFASASNGGRQPRQSGYYAACWHSALNTTGSFAITDGTYFYTPVLTLSTAGLPALTTTGEVYNDAGAAAALPETTIAGVVYIEDTLPLTGGYTYLIAKYDGANGGEICGTLRACQGRPLIFLIMPLSPVPLRILTPTWLIQQPAQTR